MIKHNLGGDHVINFDSGRPYVAAYFYLTVRYKCCRVESRSAVDIEWWRAEVETWHLTTVLQF